MSRKDSLLKLKLNLEGIRDDLRKKLAIEAGLSSQAIPSTKGDFADVANADVENELHKQLEALESRELAQVEKALQAFREDRYGDCEACGRPIPITRLKALPYTSLCVECQKIQEESGSADGGEDADWEFAFDQECRNQDREFSVRDFDLGK